MVHNGFYWRLNNMHGFRVMYDGFHWCLNDSHRLLYDVLLANLHYRLSNLNQLLSDLYDRLRWFDNFDCVVVLYNLNRRRLYDLFGDLHDRPRRFNELHDMVRFGDLALLN